MRAFLLQLVLFCSAATAGVDPGPLERLQARLSPLENLSASFVQRVTAADGYLVQEVQGELLLARPGKLRWQSEPPYEQLVVSDAVTLWIYDPDLEQVTIRPFQRDIARTPAILFIGDVADLGDSYQVTESAAGPQVVYSLIPVDSASLFDRIELTFVSDKPTAIALWDSLGQITRVQLDNLVINGSIPDASFRFLPPEGVDILRDD